jgi:hypothetical protein
MALANYSDLVASVGAWLHRDDLAANIPDFIALAEARISRDLRIRKQIVTTTLTAIPGNQYLALPADWIELENLSVQGSPTTNLSYVTVEQLNVNYPDKGFVGKPSLYTIEGDNLILGATPDSTYPIILTYYAKFPALATASTNALMTLAPSIYLFAALSEAAPFISDDVRVQLWDTKYRADMNALQAQDDKATHSGSMLRVKII